MKQDVFSNVHALCGVESTQLLRAGIRKFATEQAKHFMRMHDPAWIDRALKSPDWARQEIQVCRRAVDHGVQTMEARIAPYCEELARTES